MKRAFVKTASPLQRIDFRRSRLTFWSRTCPRARTLPSSAFEMMTCHNCWVAPWWIGSATTLTRPRVRGRSKSVMLLTPTANCPRSRTAAEAPTTQPAGEKSPRSSYAAQRAGQLGWSSGTVVRAERWLGCLAWTSTRLKAVFSAWSSCPSRVSYCFFGNQGSNEDRRNRLPGRETDEDLDPGSRSAGSIL